MFGIRDSEFICWMQFGRINRRVKIYVLAEGNVINKSHYAHGRLERRQLSVIFGNFCLFRPVFLPCSLTFHGLRSMWSYLQHIYCCGLSPFQFIPIQFWNFPIAGRALRADKSELRSPGQGFASCQWKSRRIKNHHGKVKFKLWPCKNSVRRRFRPHRSIRHAFATAFLRIFRHFISNYYRITVQKFNIIYQVKQFKMCMR